MANIILTTSGASFMNLAGSSGPYIPIKYFVPVYDHRYDTYVHPTSALIPTSAGDYTSAVNPTGDIIWNIDSIPTSSYSMSPSEFLVYDPNQSGTTTISNSSFDSTAFVTLRTGRPLSNSVSATSFVYSYPNWTVNGYTLVNGNSTVPTGYSTTTQKFFNTISYAPISSAAGGNARGLFKVRLGNQVGNFKFNKIALYAAKYLANGSEDTSVAPVLFAIAMLKEPIIKSNDGFNISFFELDVELQFSSNGYFSNIIFLNNTEWNWANTSLWTDQRVIIGSSAVPGSFTANAKLHIVESNDSVPFTRLTYDNVNYLDTYYSYESDYIDDITNVIKKPVMHHYLNTSAAGGNYSSIHTYLDSTTHQRYILMESFDSVSGVHQTGLLSEFLGYLEQMDIYVNARTLARFRSDGIYNDYATLVMGLNAGGLFEHVDKFLTVHGGTLLVGSNLVSGSLSASGGLYGNFLQVNNLLALNSVAGVSFLGTDATFDNLNINDSTHLFTSADFHTNVKVFGDITSDANIYSVNSVVSSLLTTSSILASDAIVAGFGMAFEGPGGLITAQNLGVSTSAHFKGPVTLAGSLVSTSVISASMVSAYNGFFELDRGVPNGYWKSFTASFTPSTGSISFTTLAQGYYTLIGKTMHLYFALQFQMTNAATTIRMTLPDSLLAAVRPVPGGGIEASFGYYGVGTHSVGGATDTMTLVSILGGNNTLNFNRSDGADIYDWPASLNNTITGHITLPIT